MPKDKITIPYQRIDLKISHEFVNSIWKFSKTKKSIYKYHRSIYIGSTLFHYLDVKRTEEFIKMYQFICNSIISTNKYNIRKSDIPILVSLLIVERKNFNPTADMVMNILRDVRLFLSYGNFEINFLQNVINKIKEIQFLKENKNIQEKLEMK
ncbi:hypothetical protein TRFO_18122 [Tritrichomonas foetus]|uniref:Uncharacterized protein n=1 Tax=Tritrichomonas foetus TaxID=1144522 RepID=A0A1J4KLN3_9EUKA|nr:hypothetical protein TRFO_18122 [Tritrichomonas foetus]|eukprot:OHT12209.1 hypothetical protein TRFO_18122 [Tritrichomonas foetus]